MTDSQKEYFRQVCHEDDSAFRQIGEAMRRTKYKYVDDMMGESWSIKRAEAVSILGEEKWLSGIDRCAFHRTACIDIPGEYSYILFDASALWR